jgi:hypothetical protein
MGAGGKLRKRRSCATSDRDWLSTVTRAPRQGIRSRLPTRRHHRLCAAPLLALQQTNKAWQLRYQVLSLASVSLGNTAHGKDRRP